MGDLAAKWEVPVETLQRLWDDFRPKLRFCPERDLDEAADSEEYTRLRLIDPDDLAYAVTRATVGAVAVLTKDRDFATAGTPVATAEILIDLRDYARAKAVEVRIKAGTTALTLAGAGAAIGAYKGIASLVRLFGRAPGIVQLVMATAALVLLAHPKGRAIIRTSVHTLGAALLNVREVLEPTTVKLIEEYTAATGKAAEAWQRAHARLPVRRGRLRLKQVAYGVILGASRPMTLAEIEGAVLARGYRPRTCNVSAYLRTVLRRDERLQHDASGRWSVRGVSGSA